MTVADHETIRAYPCLSESIKGKDENEMLKFRAKVKNYENFIRKFYLNNPNASEDQFNNEVVEYSRKLQDEIPLSATKAQKCYWKARILNQRSDCMDQALSLLQRSLKLNAYMVDAWTICSQILWEKQKLSSTFNCIKDAYNTEVSPKTLAYMSFILRLSALNCDDITRKESLLKESINKAKLAVNHIPKYPFGLYCLGMSYFYSYFNSENSRDVILDLSLQILQDAATEGFLRGDLYINMAEAALYFQNYGKALECLGKARQIEPFFCPHKLPNLLEYLSRLASECSKQQKALSHRKNASEILEGFSDDGTELIDERVSWASKNPPKRRIPDISEKEECVIVCRVLTQITDNNFPVPKVFVVTDANCTVAILTIYNVSEKFRLMVNSTVTLFSPAVINVSSPVGDFQCLRCSHPDTLLRDGKILDSMELKAVSLVLNA